MFFFRDNDSGTHPFRAHTVLVLSIIINVVHTLQCNTVYTCLALYDSVRARARARRATFQAVRIHDSRTVHGPMGEWGEIIIKACLLPLMSHFLQCIVYIIQQRRTVQTYIHTYRAEIDILGYTHPHLSPLYRTNGLSRACAIVKRMLHFLGWELLGIYTGMGRVGSPAFFLL